MSARQRIAAAFLLAALAVALYAPALRHPFLSLDDPVHLLLNPAVSRGLTADGVAWAFTTFHYGTYHPLAWISHMADVSLFGLAPAGHHAASVALHGANGALLFLFLAAATGAPWRSLAAAALFAVHPLHVESVAWVAERKDVLCATFLLLALHGWLRYVRAPSPGRYGVVAAAFALALLSKPMAVTFPLLLLALDLWPLGRTGVVPLRRLLAEKLPLLALAAAAAAVTLAAQATDPGAAHAEPIPLAGRGANALLSWWGYLGKGAWPAGLSILYPHRALAPGGIPWPLAAGALLLLAALWGAAIHQRERRRWLLAGIGWYTAALLPVLGLVQAGTHGMADRYAYLPMVGVYWAVAWTVADAWPERGRAALFVGTAAWAAVLAGVTRYQLAFWESPKALFTRAVEAAAPAPNHPAETALAAVLIAEGDAAGAEVRLRRVLAAWPGYTEAWGKLAIALAAQGRGREGEEALEVAAEQGREHPAEQLSFALALANGGKFEESRRWLLSALRLDPLSADGWYNLGVVTGRTGRTEEAIGAYREAARLDPGHGRARNNLAVLLTATGSPGEAVPLLEEAVRLDPASEQFRRNLAKALAARDGGGTATPPSPQGARP